MEELIRQLEKIRGDLTQEEFAAVLGVSQRTRSVILNSLPDMSF